MGLTLEISLDRDIKELDVFFTDLKFKAVTIAARQAVNRAADQARSQAIREIRKRRKVKFKDLKGGKGRFGFIKVIKAKGMNIAGIEATVNFSGIPLPLILFIMGQASPRRQTAPNSRRRSRKFEVVKGQKKAKKGLFVQRAKRGSRRFLVFRRGDPSDRGKGFKAQSAPSIAELLRNRAGLMRRIENTAIANLQKAYDSALKNQLRKLKL